MVFTKLLIIVKKHESLTIDWRSWCAEPDLRDQNLPGLGALIPNLEKVKPEKKMTFLGGHSLEET